MHRNCEHSFMPFQNYKKKNCVGIIQNQNEWYCAKYTYSRQPTAKEEKRNKVVIFYFPRISEPSILSYNYPLPNLNHLLRCFCILDAHCLYSSFLCFSFTPWYSGWFIAQSTKNIFPVYIPEFILSIFSNLHFAYILVLIVMCECVLKIYHSPYLVNERQWYQPPAASSYQASMQTNRKKKKAHQTQHRKHS